MRRCLHFQELWWRVFPKKHGRAQTALAAKSFHRLSATGLARKPAFATSSTPSLSACPTAKKGSFAGSYPLSPWFLDGYADVRRVYPLAQLAGVTG
jgi:hypothetical protein